MVFFSDPTTTATNNNNNDHNQAQQPSSSFSFGSTVNASHNNNTTTTTTTTTTAAPTVTNNNTNNQTNISSTSPTPVESSTQPTSNTFGFGSTSATTTATPSFGFSFGGSTNTASSAGGLFGSPPAPSSDNPSTNTSSTTDIDSSACSFSFASAATKPTTESTGFGGFSFSTPTPAATSGGFGVSAWSETASHPPASTARSTTADPLSGKGSGFTFSNPSFNITGLLPNHLYNHIATYDSILQIGSIQLHCHKHLLAFYSPVLMDLLFHQSSTTIVSTQDSNQQQKPTFNIILPDDKETCPGGSSYEHAFQILIKTMYGVNSILSTTSVVSDLVNLYLLAKQFKVQILVSQLDSKLKKELEACPNELLTQILSFLVQNQKEDLLWMINNLERPGVNMFEVSEWSQVSLDFLAQFLQNNDLKVESESHVLEVVKNWIEKNEHQQQDYSRLINCIRFPHIELRELIETVRDLNWLSEKQYITCLEYQACKEKKLIKLMNKIANRMDQQIDNDHQLNKVQQLNFTPRVLQKETDIDLLVMCDCTGSMAGEIRVAQNTIKNIMTELKQNCKGTIRFSLIAYKDHLDYPNTVVSHPFTTDLEAAKSYVDTMFASGGGDMPEALAAALYEATTMNFSESANKYCIIIGDAPPHGMGCSGDAYPDGDPNGHDWLQLADKLNEMQVTCYTIVCDRAKECNQLTLFMDTVAKKTNGRCILLTEADKLPDVIVKGTVEDVELEAIFSDYVNKYVGLENIKNMSNEELTKEFKSYVDKNNITVNKVHVWNCENSSTASLLNSNRISDNEKRCFGFGATTSAPSVPVSSGFSFGSSTYEAPSMEQLSGATVKVKRKFGFE